MKTMKKTERIMIILLLNRAYYFNIHLTKRKNFQCLFHDLIRGKVVRRRHFGSFWLGRRDDGW